LAPAYEESKANDGYHDKAVKKAKAPNLPIFQIVAPVGDIIRKPDESSNQQWGANGVKLIASQAIPPRRTPKQRGIV